MAAERRRKRRLKRRYRAGGVARLRDAEAKERCKRSQCTRGTEAGAETELLRLVQEAGTQEDGGVRAKKRRKLATKVMDETYGERDEG